MGTKDLHLLPTWPGLLVAFMARSCLDVFRSQNKVDRQQGGWTCSAGRTRELRKYLNRPDLRPHFDERDMICKVKQDVWRWLQAPELQAAAGAAASAAASAAAGVGARRLPARRAASASMFGVEMSRDPSAERPPEASRPCCEGGGSGGG